MSPNTPSKESPLVLVPGFLGSASDWDEVAQHLPIQPLQLPLPSSPQHLFELTQTLPPFDLVGYSMGGRIALQFTDQFPNRVRKLVLISSHLGLGSEEEKRERLALDKEKAYLLTTDLEEFLNMWYNQPLFKPLVRKRDIVKERRSIDPELHAKALIQMSLGNQKNFWNQIPPSTHFILGELDPKYRLLYKDLPHRLISDSGHAIHLEEPQATAQAIWEYLK